MTKILLSIILCFAPFLANAQSKHQFRIGVGLNKPTLQSFERAADLKARSKIMPISFLEYSYAIHPKYEWSTSLSYVQYDYSSSLIGGPLEQIYSHSLSNLEHAFQVRHHYYKNQNFKWSWQAGLFYNIFLKGEEAYAIREDGAANIVSWIDIFPKKSSRFNYGLRAGASVLYREIWGLSFDYIQQLKDVRLDPLGSGTLGYISATLSYSIGTCFTTQK